jgi:hypothetical protein
MTVWRTPRRVAFLVVLGTLAALSLAGCAAWAPRSFTLSQAELQALIDRQFPREQRVAEVFELRLSRPVVSLQPDRHRIGTELALSVLERLSGRTVQGTLAMDFGLRYEASDATLRLAHVKVQELSLDLGGSAPTAQRSRLASLLAERVLDDLVVYRLDERKRETMHQAGWTRIDVDVDERGVELRFAEAR